MSSKSDAAAGYEEEGGGGKYEDESPALRIDSSVLVEGTPPAARGGHTSFLVNDDTMVVFGGTYYKGDNKFVYLDDTWCMDLAAMTWYMPRLKRGPRPEGRYGHSMTLVNDTEAIVFGGRAAKGKYLKDMWLLDMSRSTFAWTRISSATAPPSPRFGHSAVLVGNHIVIFGGNDGQRSFDELWLFSVPSMTWQRPRTAGPPPSPRYNHSCELLPDGRLMVFAGYTSGAGVEQKYLDDVKELDTTTMCWSRPRVTGEFPKARQGQTTCMMGRQMVVFGGWSGPKKKSWDDEGNAALQNMAVKTSDQLLCLDTGSMQWFQPTFGGEKLELLYGHTATRVGASIWIIGGWDGTRPLNTVSTIVFPPPDIPAEGGN